MTKIRRAIEASRIILKEDLKIADICQSIKENLLSFINKEYFSPELAAYFNREDPTKSFIINATDPSQVAVLKKLINALEHTEKAIRNITHIDLSQNRYEAAMLKDLTKAVAKATYGTIDDVYGILQLINHSSPAIQKLLSPHLKVLLPQMAKASESLAQYIPDPSAIDLGASLADAISFLPKEAISKEDILENLSLNLFELPNYFQQLEQFISKSPEVIPQPSPDNPEVPPPSSDNKERLLQESKKLQMDFEKLSSSSHFSLFKNYLTIVHTLAGISVELVNVAAPITQEAYLRAIDTLNQIKHTILPQLIAELEQAEENLGLKPGVLTEPALKQMNSYYTKLATKVENMAEFASGAHRIVEEKSKLVDFFVGKKINPRGGEASSNANLLTMMDAVFVENRKAYQRNRLSQAQFDNTNRMALDAAERFFEKMATFTPLAHAWSLANIEQSDKELLMADYKVFQTHFAALHPALDKMIVDTLTKPKGTSFVSNLYNAQYKQLFSNNHFKQILACEKSVIDDIKQTLAQANFKAKLIKNTMEHSAATHQAATPKIELTEGGGAPFKPISPEFEPNPSVEQLHQRGLDFSNQKIKLEELMNHVNDFFSLLSGKDDETIHEFSENDKEKLRRSYQQFQEYVLAITLHDTPEAQQFSTINSRIIQSLTTDDPIDPVLTVASLEPMKEVLLGSLLELIETSKKTSQAYFDREKTAIKTSFDKAPLSEMGSILLKETLFGKLSELHLSKTLDEFFTFKFEPYLKNNLSPLLWNQLSTNGNTIDETKLPFSEFHKDSAEIVIYKQLINSMYHLKRGLKQLESVQELGNPNLMRSKFVLPTIVGSILELDSAVDFLTSAAKSPELRELLSETLDILHKAKDLPVLGEYLTPHLNATTLDAPPIDMVKAWEAQQKIVKAGLLNNSAPEAESLPSASPPITPPVSETDYLKLIATHLYEIPQKLKGQPNTPQTEKKINDFIEGLSGLYFGPSSMKKILNTLIKFQIQISSIGKESRELLLNSLKEIRTEIGAEMIAAADNAEFRLGLKPGTLSTDISQKFEKFYASLIQSTPLNTQQKLELLLNTGVTDKRITLEQERMERISIDDSALAAKNSLFGQDHEQFDEINAIYEEMDQIIAAVAEGELLLTVKDQLLPLYERLNPFLKEIDEEESTFGVDYLKNIHDEVSFKKALDDLRDVQGMANYRLGSFERLNNLILFDDDFSDPKVQKKFLKIYQDMQPYLAQIEHRYDPTSIFVAPFLRESFLRELQTPKDFKKEAEQLLALKDKLNELLAGMDATKALKIALCKERLSYLQNKIMSERSDLQEQIETFKSAVFGNYIHTQIKNAFDRELGQFGKTFFTTILPELMESKEALLKKLPIEDNNQQKVDIEAVIAERVDTKVAEIASNYRELKNTYAELNNSLNKIEHSITQEMRKANDPENNLCRAEKLAHLESIRESILNVTQDSMQAINQDIKYFLKQEPLYDVQITLYEILNNMKDMIGKEVPLTKISADKLTQIHHMQGLLTANAPLSNRLKTLKDHAFTKECKTIFSKAPESLQGMDKSFFSNLLNSQKKDESLFTFFKQKLTDGKESPDVQSDHTKHP